MTEAEWLACSEPDLMLLVPQLRSDIGKLQRKMQLFACGCCRLLWDILADKRSRKAVRKLEDFADDLENTQLRRDALNIANAAFLESTPPPTPNSYAAARVLSACSDFHTSHHAVLYAA